MSYLLQIAVVSAIYFVTGKLGLSLAFEFPQVTGVWPPSGIALAILILRGERLWPGVALGAFLVNATANEPLLTAAGIAVGNTLEAVIGTILLRAGKFSPKLERPIDVIMLIAFCSLLSTLVSATIGAGNLYLAGMIPSEKFPEAWWRWWVGDAASIWSVTPLLLTWNVRSYSPGNRWRETLIIFALLAITSYVSLFHPIGGLYRVRFLAFPIVAWAAVRLGQRKTALASMLIISVAIVGVLYGSPTFGGPDTRLEERLGVLMLFTGAIAGMALLLGALTAEREKGADFLRQREQQLMMALNAGRMGTWEWNIHTGVVTWSRNLAALHGFQDHEFDGTFEAFMETVHPDDRLVVLNAIQKALMQQQEYIIEYRSRRPDNTTFYTHARGTVVVKGGKPVRMLGLCADITERRETMMALQRAHDELEQKVRERTLELNRAVESLNTEIKQHELTEQALRSSELRYRQLVEHSPEPVIVIRDKRIAFINRAALGLFGAEKSEQLLIRPPLELIHPDDRERFSGRLADVLKGNVTPLFQKRIVRLDGVVRDVDLIASPYSDQDGQAIQLVLRDITERRRGEEALKDQARRKDEFIAMLAHELRNPMAPIRNAVNLVKTMITADSKIRRSVDMIDRQITHMVRLVDDLLDVSRISHGKILLRKQRLDLVKLLRTVLDEYGAEMEARKHVLEASLPAEPLWIDGDPTRLTQVVGNLLHNAAKFTPPGGRITLSASKTTDNFATFSVRDTGIGMEPEIVEKIFMPFTQAEHDLSRSFGGLGLGLALARGLVEMHGGRISATSEGIGRGAEFTVALPQATAPAVPLPEAGAEAAAAALKILIVEDNLDAAESLRLLLENYGHTVAVAYSGLEGLDIASEFHPDVIFCDIGLPQGMSGYDFATRYRNMPIAHHAHLIAMTGYGQMDDKRHALEAGFDHHITKPSDITELKALLAQISKASAAP
jgi:PAS domain S-box-containing protein